MTKRKPHLSDNVMYTDEQRLSRLEVRQVQTETQQEAIFEAIKAQSRNIEAMSDKFGRAIDDLSNKISAGSQTDWRMIFTGLGLVVTLLGAFGFGIIAPVLERVKASETAIQIHSQLEAHPPTMVSNAIALEKLRWIEHELESWDTSTKGGP